MPIAADKITISPKVGEGDEAFDLAAESPEDGKASVFMLEDAALAMGIPLGVDIKIMADGKAINGEIKAHEPLDH